MTEDEAVHAIPAPNQQAIRAMLESLALKRDDFTLIVDRQKLDNTIARNSKTNWLTYCRSLSGKPAERQDFDFQEILHGKLARINACSAYAGKAWSITVRWKAPADLEVTSDGALEYAHAGAKSWGPDTRFELTPALDCGFLFTAKEIAEVVYRCAFAENDQKDQGFILITGPTASMKSNLAQALVSLYLKERQEKNPNLRRRLHLLAHEDPVEKYLLPDNDYDYTPRQAPQDTASLRNTFESALRQTPAIVYAGELRDESQIKRCAQFAGTGHLVIATAHAGSLLEAVEKIFRATRCTGPGQRAMVVPKIHSVIHMAQVECEFSSRDMTSKRFGGLVPAIYRRTTQGVQNLIADGLTSLLPYSPADIGTAGGSSGLEVLAASPYGSLSRTSVARVLCGRDCYEDALSELRTSNPTEHELVEQTARFWSDLRRWNGNLDPYGRDGATITGTRLCDAAFAKDLHGN